MAVKSLLRLSLVRGFVTLCTFGDDENDTKDGTFRGGTDAVFCSLDGIVVVGTVVEALTEGSLSSIAAKSRDWARNSALIFVVSTGEIIVASSDFGRGFAGVVVIEGTATGRV